MSIVISDIQLLASIAATRVKPKTTHRWPAGVTKEGYLCRPRMSIGSEQKVYERAPYGKHGNPYQPPLLIVQIDDIWNSCPHQWTDEGMIEEGFPSVHDYAIWWDRWKVGDHNCKPWVEMQDTQFWVCRFHLVGRTEYFRPRCESHAKEAGLRVE